MKQNKRIFAILAAAILLIVTLAGCGAPKVSPEETVKIIVDAMVKRDFTSAEKLKSFDKASQEKFIESVNKQSQKMLMTIGRSAKVKISEEDAKRFVEGIAEMPKKSTISTKLVSKEDKSATVELSMTCLDNEKFNKAYTELILSKLKNMSQQDASQQGGKIIVDSFLETMDRTEFNQEPYTMQIKCVLSKDNEWIPEENPAMLGQKLSMAIWGMPI